MPIRLSNTFGCFPATMSKMNSSDRDLKAPKYFLQRKFDAPLVSPHALCSSHAGRLSLHAAMSGLGTYALRPEHASPTHPTLVRRLCSNIPTAKRTSPTLLTGTAPYLPGSSRGLRLFATLITDRTRVIVLPLTPHRMLGSTGRGLLFYSFLYPRNTAQSGNPGSTEQLDFLDPHLILPFCSFDSFFFLRVPLLWIDCRGKTKLNKNENTVPQFCLRMLNVRWYKLHNMHSENTSLTLVYTYSHSNDARAMDKSTADYYLFPTVWASGFSSGM